MRQWNCGDSERQESSTAILHLLVWTQIMTLTCIIQDGTKYQGEKETLSNHTHYTLIDTRLLIKLMRILDISHSLWPGTLTILTGHLANSTITSVRPSWDSKARWSCAVWRSCYKSTLGPGTILNICPGMLGIVEGQIVGIFICEPHIWEVNSSYGFWQMRLERRCFVWSGNIWCYTRLNSAVG